MIQTPRPDWELGPADTAAAYTVFALAFIAALGYLIRKARAERTLWPLYLMAGAGLAVVYEPINNVLALCTYPEIGQLTWISAMGRRIPVYIGLVYCVYWSAPVLWLMHRIKAGITARQWWSWYAIATVAVTCFELIPLQRGWWSYYGDHQPLEVARFPMWWWVVNSQAIFGLAALLHHLRTKVLTSERTGLLVIPALPLMLFFVHGGPSIPVVLAVNSTIDQTVINLAGLASIALGLMSMWVYGRLAVGQGQRDTGALRTERATTTAAS
jgi:hypothetical protein